MAKTDAGTDRLNRRHPRSMATASGAPGKAHHKTDGAPGRPTPDHSQLEQIIAGLTEGVILVEPDQTITYANEAALEMHGVASLDGLGRTVDEYRRNFILRHQSSDLIDHGRYPIDRVIAGEAFDDVLVVVAHKDDQDRDRTHRIRSLVITDRAGNPDCLVLVVDDVSGQIEAEDRFERTFAANPAPAIICRLADLRLIKVNEGFLELTGYRREDVLGRSVYEIHVLERGDSSA